VIYLDASALVTFVIRRKHAEELDEFLASTPSQTYTSSIGLIETVRTCDRLGSYPNLMARLLRDHTEIKVTADIRDAAAHVPGALGSLDAVHVASAQQLGSELISLVTYDKRMADAARAVGLPVAMPGLE
jgi:predicted nucleic acid-binding protein